MTRRPLILQLIHVPYKHRRRENAEEESYERDKYFDASAAAEGNILFTLELFLILSGCLY